MKLICPACGAVASAETWSNDPACREMLRAITSLPAPLPSITLDYISLFRPGSRALTWKKALRLVTEIRDLVAKNYVHVQGQVDRTCVPSMWARGMEQMVEQKDALRLPMKSHGYLVKIVWDLADAADRQREKQPPGKAVIESRLHSGPNPIDLSPVKQYIAGLRDTRPTDEEMAEWNKAQLK